MASSPSRNGKNASDAATEPASGFCPFSGRPPSSPPPARHRRGSSGPRQSRACATASVKITAFDLTCARDAPGKAQGSPFRFARRTFGDDLQPRGSERLRAPRLARLHHLVSLLHEHRAENRPDVAPARRVAAGFKSATTTRMFALAARMGRASSSTPGATTASMNVDTSARAVAASIGTIQTR